MEDLNTEEFPCVEYLTVQPDSLEQIFFTDNSMVYMHEGQYYITTDSQMMLLDDETANQELAMVQEEDNCVPDEELHSRVMCEGMDQQDEVYELSIIEGDGAEGNLNQIKEEEEEEDVNIDESELADVIVETNEANRRAGTLHRLLETVPKKKKECKPENGSPRLSTYLSGKLMYGRILDVRRVDEIQKSDEYCESIGRTLVGLMQIDSLRKSFESNPLIIKVNELEDSKQVYKGKVHGFMKKDENEGWHFVNFNDQLEGDALNEAKIKFRYVNHICVTITLSRCMGNLKATKVFKSLEQKQHLCIVCFKEFGSMMGLHHHYFTHLDTDPDLLQLSEIESCTCEICCSHTLRNHKCNVCEQRYKDAWALRRHLLTHTRTKPHACDLCDRSFTLVGDLNTHKKTHYGSRVHVYMCMVCGRTFSRQGNLLRHAGIHNNGEHKCHICGSSYQYVSSLTRHIMQTHVSTNT